MLIENNLETWTKRNKNMKVEVKKSNGKIGRVWINTCDRPVRAEWLQWTVVSWSLKLMSNQRPIRAQKHAGEAGGVRTTAWSCPVTSQGPLVIAPYTAQTSYSGKPGRSARLFGISWWSRWDELAEKVTGEGLEGLEADQPCWLLAASAPRSMRSRNLLQRLHSLPNTELEKTETQTEEWWRVPVSPALGSLREEYEL